LRNLLAILLVASCAAAYAANGKRDDVLVIVNDNSIDSVLIGEYYAQQRDIDPGNIVHVRVPNSFFIDWDAFKSLRDQLVSFMQVYTLDDSSLAPVICSNGDQPYYCPESVEQLRLHTGIRYLVTTRGVPTRMVVDGSPLFDPNAPTSVDNYLKYWLLNYFSGDIKLDFPEREVAFEDGRGMRTVQPAQDKELIVGRVDGVNLEAAKALIDRAIEAERNGIYGKLYPSTSFAEWQDYRTGESVLPDWHYPFRYWLALAGESRSECLDYVFQPSTDPGAKTPQDCIVQLNQQLDPPPARPDSRQPTVHDALLYLGHTDGSATAGSFSNFLNWKKDAQCSVTLCKDAVDPDSCRLNSSDVFHEINTQCVGVADGFIGFNEQSYPMSYLTVWPTAWFGPGGGDSNQLAFPEVRTDIGYDDQVSLWFRNADQIATPKCYSDADFSSPPSVDCSDERRISIKQNIALSSQMIDDSNPQQYRIGLWYKVDNIDRPTNLLLSFRVREVGGSSADINYGTQRLVMVSTGDTDWTYGEVTFQLNPALHSTLEYDRITVGIETPAVFAGELGVDAITVQESSDGLELAVNRSFTQGHKQVSTGDHAANFLSRLNGVGFWGSVSHHQSGGFSFFNNAMETIVYFMRGLPLGDAVWFGESQNSGILYGDPLYSPMAIHLNYLNVKDTVAGPVDLYGSTINGRDPSRISTSYTVDYCPGEDLLICEDGVEPWYPTGISGAGGQANTLLGAWDTRLLPAPGPYTLRLAVTSQNITSGKSQTFYDYYRVNVADVNDTPMPSAPPILTDEDTGATTQVVPNDPDVGDSHSYEISSSPAHGRASVTATGLVTYTPAPDYSGVDSLVVTVTDATGATGSVSISITVNPVSDGPDRPVLIPPSADVPLRGYTFDVTGFSNPRGDSQLSTSEWEIGTDPGFASSAIVLHRVLEEMGSLMLPFGIVEKGQTYWIRTRHQDSQGAWSSWAEPLVFVTSLTDPNDLDGNDVDDRHQVTGAIDTNENGIDDNQEGMCHLRDAEENRVIGIRSQQGVVSCLTALDTTEFPVQSAGELPYGLLAMRIDALTPGATVELNLYFPDALQPGSKWIKYDQVDSAFSDFTPQVTFNGKQVTVRITDGGVGDADGVANGIIIDPSGPWVVASGSSSNSNPEGSSGGGGCTIKASSRFDPVLFILWLVSLVHITRHRYRRQQVLSHRTSRNGQIDLRAGAHVGTRYR
jgi:uncharacterized protein (TIGR03790 family)